jgi:hypothetical protein
MESVLISMMVMEVVEGSARGSGTDIGYAVYFFLLIVYRLRTKSHFDNLPNRQLLLASFLWDGISDFRLEVNRLPPRNSRLTIGACHISRFKIEDYIYR